MDVKDFINGRVSYDKYGGQYFWINLPNGGTQMLAEMRGWGAIQNMFLRDGKPTSEDWDERAAEYQDKIGNWIAEAINEKLERECNS